MTIANKLIKLGVSSAEAERLYQKMTQQQKTLNPEQSWQQMLIEFREKPYEFAIQKSLYEEIYKLNWNKMPKAAWFPSVDIIQQSNAYRLMSKKGFKTFVELHRWSVVSYQEFWQTIVDLLKIQFDQPYRSLVNFDLGLEKPQWFYQAKMNIVNSCFQADSSKCAIIYQKENGPLQKISYGELLTYVDKIADSVSKYFKCGDRIAITMPMTYEAVALYLGIIKAGCSVISIADSFSAEEINIRLRIANAKAVFTQDEIIRDNKHLPLYEKVVAAKSPLTIVVPQRETLSVSLQKNDLSLQQFLSRADHNHDLAQFKAYSASPSDYINILFSSGTTGEPKAIPWTHSVAVKCASDAYFHHDIHEGDVLAWPTNLGWMMGPWLIFASLINRATIALYEGTPNSRKFGQFIQDAQVNMLGVVPTLVKTWRNSECMKGLDWQAIKVFSSTGECSNAEDMLYLMSLANYKPIIEYCGGTEIGGAYITSTILEPCIPSACKTPALGLDFVILDDEGHLANNGEVALVPPSIGLSTELLNKDHHQVYYANMPTIKGYPLIRRHGDQILKDENGYYRILGRADDTMNLGGIKTSSAEIESTLNLLNEVSETAAIAVPPPDGGPSLLIVYVVLKPGVTISKTNLMLAMQKEMKQHLNPLFKIEDIVIKKQLPRTASNKVMRRQLRDEYKKEAYEKNSF